MHSMTGFGSCSAVFNDTLYNIEFRSVNHRFLELKIRAPFNLHETQILPYVRQYCSRGSLQLSIRAQSAEAGLVQSQLALTYERALAQLAFTLGYAQDNLSADKTARLLFIAQKPGVLSMSDERISEIAESALAEAMQGALEDLQRCRAREGKKIKQILVNSCSQLQKFMARLRKDSTKWGAVYLRTLEERIRRLIKGAEPDLQIGLAIATLVAQSDIQEELDRFDIHLEEFLRLCEVKEPVGRQLEFLLQEMLREINTLGSKAAPAALNVVAIKTELERLREQIQNIE